MAGGVERFDRQPADLDLVSGVEVAGRAGDALGRVGEDGGAGPAGERVAELGNVVVVVVGEEDVG